MTPKQMEQQCKAMGLAPSEMEQVLETFRVKGESAALVQAKAFVASKKHGRTSTESELNAPASLVVLDDPVGQERKKMTDLVTGQGLAGVAEVIGAIVS